MESFDTKNLYLAKTGILKFANGSLYLESDKYIRYAVVYMDSSSSMYCKDAFSNTYYILARKLGYDDRSDYIGMNCISSSQPISLLMKIPSNEISSDELISILNRFDELRKNMFGINDVILRLIVELNTNVSLLENISEEEKVSITNKLYFIANSYVKDLVDLDSGKLLSGTVESIRGMYLKEILKVENTIDMYLPRQQTKMEDEFDNLKLLMNRE